MKKWIIGKPDDAASAELAKQCGLSPLCSSVLVSRGINSVQKACDFFNFRKDNSQPALSDPFLTKDMKAAADAVRQQGNLNIQRKSKRGSEWEIQQVLCFTHLVHSF